MRDQSLSALDCLSRHSFLARSLRHCSEMCGRAGTFIPARVELDARKATDAKKKLEIVPTLGLVRGWSSSSPPLDVWDQAVKARLSKEDLCKAGCSTTLNAFSAGGHTQNLSCHGPIRVL